MTTLRTKVHMPSYIMCVLLFWYSTELLMSTRTDSFLGVPIDTLNLVQSYFVLLLLLIQIVCFQRYKKQELIRIGLFFAVVIIATIMSGFHNILLSFTLFALASKDVDFDRVIRMIYHVTLILVPFVMVLCGLGVIEDFIVYRLGVMPRHSLGFGHPNVLGQRVFILLACRFYLHFQKLKWWDYLLAIGAAVFCYIVPNSQTATVQLILMVLIVLLYKVAQSLQKEKLFSYMLLLGAFVCNIGSVVLSSIDLRLHPNLQLFDRLLSSRFSACHLDIETFGISIFGQTLPYTDNGLFTRQGVSLTRLYMDNSYCAILLIYGVVAFALFSVLYLRNMDIQIRKKRYSVVIFLFLSAVYGVMEWTLFTLSINVFLISFADVFYCTQKAKSPLRAKQAKLHTDMPGNEGKLE